LSDMQKRECNIMNFQKMLLEIQDTEYADFQAKLTPTVARENFIGVRVPDIRKMAKVCAKDEECDTFLRDLPHRYFEENMLHACILSELKDYDKVIEYLELFLPYVDNWAVCDSMIPKVFKKHRAELMEKIKEWSVSEKCYTCRFGIKMLMSHFLDGDFNPEYHEIAAVIRSDEYYINMMTAWYFATALAKQWESTIGYIENNRLDVWTHNKAIQKARESFRVSDEHKAYLNTLKIK